MPSKISPEETINFIKQASKKAGKNNLSTEEFLQFADCSIAPLFTNFGSIKTAFRVAGLDDYIPKTRKIPEIDVIEDIKTISKKLTCNSLSCLIYERNGGKYSREVIERIFGSYKNAFAAAGLNEHINSRIIADDMVLEDLRNVYRILDRTFSQEEYIEYGKYSKNTLSYKFGSFKQSLELAGIESKTRVKKYTEKELLLYLKKFYKEFGHVPTVLELSQTKGYPSERPYWETFPGKIWAEILGFAGLKTEHKTQGINNIYYDSNAESKVANQLYRNFIEFESHKKVCNDRLWKCDFYITRLDLWVEYDGLGSRRKQIKRYQEKLQFYKDNNYNFIELHEGDDIFEKCNLYLPITQPEIKSISFNEADTFLQRVHYLSNATRGSKYYGGFINDQLVGVVCVGSTSNPKETSLAITRIAWLDIVRNNRNFGSSFISRVLREIKKSYSGPVVSWSDPRYHDGTLYRACNFEQVKVKSRTDYVYIDVDGNEYHKSKCRVPAGQSEPEYAKSLGLTKIRVPPKQKWRILV